MTQVPMVVRPGFPTAGTIKVIYWGQFLFDLTLSVPCSNDLPIYYLELNRIWRGVKTVTKMSLV